MDEIILIGAGGHANSCIDVIELEGKYKVAGLVDKNKSNHLGSLGYAIIGTDDDLEALRKKFQYAIITVGQIKLPEIRVRLYDILARLDYSLPSIISPKAYVSKYAQINEGTIVMHGSIVNSNAKIGRNCIINNKALIEHDAIIGDHCHISTGAIINGKVTIGNKNFIGSGVVTKESVSIGSNCVIGAGVIIKTDINSNQVIKN